MPFKIENITNSKKIPVWLMLLVIFLCYTSMYAVRKSFLAGQYKDLSIGFEIDSKIILVISQVLGYMISKFIGIKIISEMKKNKRAVWLISFISFSLLMLGLFAIAPPKLKVLALFLNGLPLGMIFGLVFSYIEGRKNTELLAAALSATFIFSTGFVKTIGLILMQDFNISEYNMPFATGLIFFPIFLISVYILNKTSSPSISDLESRKQRVPMHKEDRKAFIKHNGLGYFGLVGIYILLTLMRDFRDNFIVEFWAEMGFKGTPEIVTLTEIPIAIIVLLIAATGTLIRKNKIAFNTSMWFTALGALIIIVTTVLFDKNMISPVFWIITSGIGIYLPYILFHCMIFERLVALLHFKGNVGFLFYTADAMGYLVSVAVLFLKEIITFKQSWGVFFTKLNLQTATLMLLLTIVTLWYFNRRFTKQQLYTLKNE